MITFGLLCLKYYSFMGTYSFLFLIKLLWSLGLFSVFTSTNKYICHKYIWATDAGLTDENQVGSVTTICRTRVLSCRFLMVYLTAKSCWAAKKSCCFESLAAQSPHTKNRRLKSKFFWSSYLVIQKHAMQWDGWVPWRTSMPLLGDTAAVLDSKRFWIPKVALKMCDENCDIKLSKTTF